MAESLYTTYVEIVGDSSPLEKEWRRIKRSSIKHADDIGKSVASRLTSRLTGLIGVLYSLKRAWDFALDAKNLARDADEIRSKFDQVFISIKEGANEIADSFSKNFGLAGSTARDLLSQTGDLLIGFGFTEQQALDLSLQINELAQDLTSFTNFEGGAKDASLSLTKALLGETESAKKLGIVIRQG